MKQLSDITLLIPTYRRHRFALRQMDFWSGREAIIHVLDGSQEPIPDHMMEGMSPNVHYHHLPSSFQQRMRTGSELVETNFCAMLCDDEFFIPSGLEACARFLENNVDYAACGGQCLRFNIHDGNVLGIRAYSALRGRSIVGKDAGKRMLRHMRHYTPSSVYALHRTGVFNKVIEASCFHEFSAATTFEMLFELATASQGNLNSLDTLTWLRSGENEPIIQEGWDRKLTFSSWLLDSSYNMETDRFFEAVGNVVDTPHDRKALQNQARSAVNEYLRCQGHLPHPRGKVIVNALKKAVWRLLHPLEQHVPDIGLRTPPTETLVSAAKSLAKSGVTVDAAELSSINDRVLSFHGRSTDNKQTAGQS